MSFRCEICGEVQPVCVTVNRVVTRIRDRGGSGAYEAVGTEIAEEKNACSDCAANVVAEKLLPEPVLDAVADPSFV